jgi:hypothetical protein
MVSPSSGAFVSIGNLGTLGRPDMRVAISSEKSRKKFSFSSAFAGFNSGKKNANSQIWVI